MSEEMNREIEILKNVHTINDFLTICKIFPSVEDLFDAKLKENFFEVREILSKLDHSFEMIPRDPFDLNFYLWICHRFRLSIDHLANFKKFVLIEKMDIAFEYLKRGIFISNTSSFAEMLRSEKDEKFYNSFFILNDSMSRNCSEEETLAYSTISSHVSSPIDKDSAVKLLIMEYIKSSPEKHDSILSCLYLLSGEYTLDNILNWTKSISKSFQNYSQFENKIKLLFNVKSIEVNNESQTRQVRALYDISYEKFDEILNKYKGDNLLSDFKLISFDGDLGSTKRAKYNPQLFSRELPSYVSKDDAYLFFWLINLRTTKNIKLFLGSFRMSFINTFLNKYSDYVGDEEARSLYETIIHRIGDVNSSCVETPDWIQKLYYGSGNYLF